MRLFTIGALAVVVATIVACEDITNPVEEFGKFAPAWVGFDDPLAANGSHGTYTEIIYGALTTRPEEDVEIDISFGGDAVYGEDFVVVSGPNGSPRTDMTESGGTLLLEADPNREEPVDTLWVYVPEDATVGRTLVIEMEDARTVTGAEITVGYLGEDAAFELTVIPGPADIPEGAYWGTVNGDFGAGGIPPVTITESPVTIGGATYRYQISDYSYGLFGVDIPWAFNVYSDGSVEFAQSNPAMGVTSDVSGSYDLEANELTMDVTLTCCGAAGSSWTTVYTLE